LRRRRGVKMVRFFDSRGFFGYFFGSKKVTKPGRGTDFALNVFFLAIDRAPVPFHLTRSLLPRPIFFDTSQYFFSLI